jgi:hypothetical protein
VASLSGVQPHTPPAPQTCGETHEPHEATVRLVPQLSAAVTLPQFFPRREQNAVSVSGVQHTLPALHTCCPVQLPHEPTVRLAPQLSGAVTLPQSLPRREQNVLLFSAVQPHTFAVPPPAHVCGDVHVPQFTLLRAVPQLSVPDTVPQFLPNLEQNVLSLSGMQQTFEAVHTCGVVQVPHVTVLLAPQLSAAVTLPQVLPSRVQNVVSPSYVQPHRFAVPPPAHVCGDVHVPHEVTVRAAPQLSFPDTVPQFFPTRVQNAASVSAVQPHTLATDGVAPPHVCGAVHVPHEATVRDAPQLSAAVTLPQFLPNRVQNAGSVSAVHPHTLATDGVAPPHVCGAVHVPQFTAVRVVPQLSAAVTFPQFFPSRVQNAVLVSAVQPHTLATDGVAPPHV